jgi:phosphoglycolate phosphatase-like HAD superfamily hydrolase
MTIKAIIFDVDGTLADTEDGHGVEGAAAVFEDLSDLSAFFRIAGLPLPRETGA